MSMSDEEPRRFVVNKDLLPEHFPTHRHAPEFWENLGRAVATFGFLEDVLARAIFALTGTRRYEGNNYEAAFEQWIKTLERALYDPLGNLISSYEKALRDHPEATITNAEELVSDLRAASTVRNVLCHGSWGSPDSEGRSLPKFVDRKLMIFDTRVDLAFLQQTQKHTAELVCEVMNTVSHMGWQFPGTTGPGTPIMTNSRKS